MEPDKENRQEDLCAASAASRSKRRSSILKEVCEMTRFIEEQTQLVDQTENTAAIARRKSKRVSFAETKKIKVFQSSISDGTEWNSSYAALVSSSSSNSSGAATTLDAGHDSTHGERTRTSLTDQLQQLPTTAGEAARHRLQASQQPFQNEYEVDVDANFDDDNAGSSSDFLSCFLKQQPSQSRPSQPHGESSEQAMDMTCAAAFDNILNSESNQRVLGGYGGLDQTCIADVDMEQTCAISVQRSATHIISRSETSADGSEEMELTSEAALVCKPLAQACLTTVGTGVPNSLGSNDEQGISDMDSTCTASNVAKLLSDVAASQEFEQQTGEHGTQPALELTAWVENEDMQVLADMKLTCVFPNLHKSDHLEAEEVNEDTRGVIDMEFTCAVPNLHSVEAVEGNEDTRGFADMEFTCAVPNLHKMNLSVISADTEDTRGLADMELTCAVPNLCKMKPSEISAENEDTRGLADMELTSAVPNLHELKPSVISVKYEDTNGLRDMELTCAVSNLHKMKPSEISAEDEDTMELAERELSSAVPNLPKLKPSVISAENEDTRGLVDMELTSAVPNLQKLKPGVISAEDENTMGLADMELTSAVPNLPKLKPSVISAENNDTRGLADMELTSAVSNLQKLKPGVISSEDEYTSGLADMELFSAVPNLPKLKPGVISSEDEYTRGLADKELTSAVPNLPKLKPSVISAENEDTKGLADMELTSAVPNVPKLIPSVISAKNEDTRGLADMELTSAVPNVHEMQPSEMSAENEDTRGLADMELSCTVSFLHKQKPIAITVVNEDADGLADMELTAAIPNLQKLKPSAISTENNDTGSIAGMELACSTSNLDELGPQVPRNLKDGTQMVVTDELETTCTTASDANMESQSTQDNEVTHALQGSCFTQALSQVNLATNSGMVSQSVTESQPTEDEARKSSEDAMARISSGTREFGPTHASSLNKDANVSLSSKSKHVEAEKKLHRIASENVAGSDALETVVRRKSILYTKAKYNGEKSIGEDERAVQFCMEVDVHEMNRASVISDVTQDHTKEKKLEDSFHSEAVNNHSGSRAGNVSAAAIAAHTVESGLSDTAPHSSTVVSDLTYTSDEISKATREPSVSLNTSCVRRYTTADNSSMLQATPGQLVSQNRVSLAVSGKGRSSENSQMAPEKVFIMSPKHEDDARTVYRTNHSGEISDPLSLLVPATSDYSVPPVASDGPDRDHSSTELLEVKQEMNDTNSSQEFLSNVTVHLVDSDDSLMTSPEKVPNVSAVGGLVATSEGPRRANRRRSSAAAAAAMTSCRALLQSVQSAITSEHADSTGIDDIVKELNKSLSTFANSEDEESEESVSADVQDVKLENISVYPNEKDESALVNASVRPELEVKSTVDRSKSVRLSTTRTSFVLMDERDEKVDEIWNREIVRDTICQPTDQAAAAHQTVAVEDDDAHANIVYDDRVRELIEIQKPSENTCVAMLPIYNKSVQLLSTKPCANSDASSRTTALDANSAVSLSSQSTEDITTTDPFAASTENSMESVAAIRLKKSPNSCPGQVDVNKSSVQVTSPAKGHVVAVGLKPKMSVIDLCQDCSPFDEIIIFKDSRDAVLLHRQGSSATLRLHHRRYSVLLALSSFDAHCTVKEAHWQPTLQELQRPMTRLAVSTFSYSLSQSCEALRGLRVCCLDSMLEPLLCSFNAVADLLLELFSLLQRFAVQFAKDRVVLLLSGRQGDLVEVSCVLRAEAAAASPRYTLLPAARSLLGCIRTASVAAAMREVDAGPLLLTRTVDAALAVVDSWQH